MSQTRTNVFRRLFKTFYQAAAAAIVVGLYDLQQSGGDITRAAITAVAVGGIGAGLSAVENSFRNWGKTGAMEDTK